MIQIEALHVQAGAFALKDVTLSVARGRCAVLMGKTGSGKTTLLEAIIGLRTITGGTVLLDGRDVTHLPPAARGIGYVPQDLALFHHTDVRGHLAFALDVRRVPRQRIDRRVDELAKLLGIAHLLNRWPANLSGGEKQRVALGRALAFEPAVLLLDEPLSALDQTTREQMYQLLRHIQQQTGVTTLHVTHNPDEAAALGDVLFRIDQGQLRQGSGNHRPAAAPSPDATDT